MQHAEKRKILDTLHDASAHATRASAIVNGLRTLPDASREVLSAYGNLELAARHLEVARRKLAEIATQSAPTHRARVHHVVRLDNGRMSIRVAEHSAVDGVHYRECDCALCQVP
jgi:hypothetical protein